MQNRLFLPRSLPSPLASVTQLWRGEPEANQLPPPSVAVRSDVNYATLRQGRKKKWGRIVEANWQLLETIRKRFPQELQFFCSFLTMEQLFWRTWNCQWTNSYLWNKTRPFIFHIKKENRTVELHKLHESWHLGLFLSFYQSCGKKPKTKHQQYGQQCLKYIEFTNSHNESCANMSWLQLKNK